MGQTELDRSTQKMMVMSTRVANHRMRAEILPQLSGAVNPNLVRSWNPLVADGLGMRLRMPDKLVAQILQSAALQAQVSQIIHESTAQGIMDNSKVEATPFIAAVIRDVFSKSSND